MTDRLLIADEVADIFRVSTESVYRLVREGLLPCVRVGHRSVRFTQEQVDDFVEKLGIRP